MKHISLVLVAALALAAVGCKKKGGDCASAVEHSVELWKADMPKPPEAATLGQTKELALRYCEDDKWSDEFLQCVSDAKTIADWRKCSDTLSKDQREGVTKLAMMVALLKAGAGNDGSGGSGMAGSSAVPVDAGMTDAEKVAKGMAEADADAATEAKRWTPDLVKAAIAVRDQTAKDTPTALAAILASPHRVPGNKDRDGARHPVETLTFFGLQPTQTVLEIGPGSGWYTELLAPFLAKHGKLIVAGPDAAAPAGKMSTVSGHRLDLFLAKSPDLFGKVGRVRITTADSLELGPANSVDLVLVIREMHDWQRDGQLDKYLAAVHAVLKPGGTLGVVAHRAAPGTKGEDTAASGYLAEAWVIDRVTAAGFELAGKSEINANPKDTKDYPKGVWTLPPGYREGDKDKAKYTAIGESDRMTLKFKKK
jgi:predicted methyltransferase